MGSIPAGGIKSGSSESKDVPLFFRFVSFASICNRNNHVCQYCDKSSDCNIGKVMRANSQTRECCHCPPNKAQCKKMQLKFLEFIDVIRKGGKYEDGKHRVCGMAGRERCKFVSYSARSKAGF